MNTSLNEILENDDIEYVTEKGAVCPLKMGPPLTSLLERSPGYDMKFLRDQMEKGNIYVDTETSRQLNEELVGYFPRNAGKSTDMLHSTKPCGEILLNETSLGTKYKQEYLCSFEKTEQALFSREDIKSSAERDASYYRNLAKAMRFAEMYGGVPKSMESKRYPSNAPSACVSMNPSVGIMPPVGGYEGVIIRDTDPFKFNKHKR